VAVLEPRVLGERDVDVGATILLVQVDGPNGGGNTGPSCWKDRLGVPPGGTLETFLTDDGLSWLAYCALSSRGRDVNPQLRLSVTFIDDGGRGGMVASVAATK
jgi:hypothetical protein